MFYCEQCRVASEWPKGTSQSVGRCEDCGQHRVCYDRPSSALPKWREVRKISLTPVEDASFKTEDLISPTYHKVHGVVSRSPRRVVLEFGKGEMADPKTDPLIMGTIRTKNGDFSIRVLWNDKLWRPWDADTDEFLGIMEGVKAGDIQEFMDKLKRA